jgi:FkbM family methyltransferase
VNPWVIKARSLARRAGVIGLVNRLRPSGAYEKRVHEALAGAVRPGDAVWDVGANVGVYTELFCQWVGREGSVVAFEPWVDSCERIRQRLPDCPWLRVENLALGASDSTGRLVTGSESVENHVETEADANNATSGAVPIVISRGDTIGRRLGRVPNVIKVDVEGFEVEVLAGMEYLLASPELRSLLVEVHFLKLERRGMMTAPNQIQKLLDSRGFRTRWVDASHLFATR